MHKSEGIHIRSPQENSIVWPNFKFESCLLPLLETHFINYLKLSEACARMEVTAHILAEGRLKVTLLIHTIRLGDNDIGSKSPNDEQVAKSMFPPLTFKN